MTDRTCAELFDHTHATIIGDADRPILGVAYRSDQVKPGDAFCCIVGLKADGHAFAQDAVDRGATVLVVERMLEVKGDNDVTFILVNDTRKAMAHLAAHFYRMPTQDLSLVGITGTNGKTTTAHLVEHIASTLGKTTGMIGTVGIDIAGKALPADHTTPESCDLQHIFAEMRDAGCDVVAMEVSSHALDLDRVWDSTFAVTAFTNLTQDHLDYHKTFEAYFAAKRRLFSADYPAKRVINIDSTWGERLVADALEQGDEVITTGFAENADLHPIEIAYDVARTRIVLGVRGEAIAFEYPLVGKFNVENVMTAFGIALELGFAPHDIARALSDVPPVPGRIEHVMLGAGEGSDRAREIAVYVDYAHTPDAIEKALASVKQLTKGKTIVVFGCGGDRDATKRPLMGKAALAADFAVVTSDNPRTESPDAIIEDIVAGMQECGERFSVEPDRKRAIEHALSLAHPGDSVLIAGKGHEDYQIIGTTKHPFDDRSVARQALKELEQ
ncbi:MAG: UDP-N-acetylmuramoyl-L-alanyl-D-glutamate--2,6-diaminopimelate ligase [Eggerthella sp.]|nr:UDP-N-acetylmuramoyl-L-alanyl-D-glutamate--2,6-diaminopimelate ligase [Eggerthella sp.]